MRTDIHQGHQTQDRVRCLSFAGGIACPEVITQLRCFLGSKQRTIDGKDLQFMPVVFRVTLITPDICALLEEPRSGFFTQTLPGFGESAVGQKHFVGQALGADIKAASDLGNRFAAKESHAHHQP